MRTCELRVQLNPSQRNLGVKQCDVGVNKRLGARCDPTPTPSPNDIVYIFAVLIYGLGVLIKAQ